ncbi:MAG: carbon-nitrogen hydrolase family protein [Blautia sp.]|nr:carbon-nitrogen hydrolase family protein [Blautia sp.]
MNFRTAVLQKRSINRDMDQNTDTIITNMEAAAGNHADLLLLPECFISGYELPIDNQDALTDDSTYIRRLCSAARQLHIGVAATALTQGTDRPQNSAYLISKDGQILMKYSKVHTCDFADENCLESGSEFKVCDFHGVKIGIMICYDREYPESARILMLKGAEIILVPNDCGAMKPRIQALSTRAYENMTGVVMANPNGENCGNSCAYSPICWDENGRCTDNTVFLADEMSEGLYYADFDMDQLRSYRENEMMGNTFRKVKAYQDLLSSDISYPFIRKGQ